MRLSRRWRMPPPTLGLVAAIAIFGTATVSAQSDLPTLTDATETATSGATSAGSATGTSQADSGTNTNTNAGTTATTSGSLPGISDSSSESAAASSKSDLPGLSTSSTSLPQAPTLTGLPTLPGGYNYPAPTVPPTTNAPYMQKSNLPEDTVFIAVGAALAFIALVILAWRVMVAWSINRSVQRAALAGYGQLDSKTTRKHSGMVPYSHDMGSTMSLDKLRPSSKIAMASKGQTPNSSLFFSPTAGAGMHTPGSKQNSSGYLPSGYYAAGASAPGGGTGMTTIGGPGDNTHNAHRLSKMPPNATHFVATRSANPSPPDSPHRQSGGIMLDNRSNYNQPTHSSAQRTPSTYLDDLMSGNVAPPQQQQQSQHHHRHQRSSRRTSRESRRNSQSRHRD